MCPSRYAAGLGGCDQGPQIDGKRRHTDLPSFEVGRRANRRHRKRVDVTARASPGPASEVASIPAPNEKSPPHQWGGRRVAAGGGERGSKTVHHRQLMEKGGALTKRRGFIFPSRPIYA